MKQHEFLIFHSNICIAKGTDESKRIKGFVSLNDPDRHKDVAPPESFNIRRFMANPQVMLNHDFWIDEKGNKITIGVVKEMFVAEVVAIKGDEDNFGIKNIDSNSIVDTFPKEQGPELKLHDKGLWAVVEITVDDIWEKVVSNELNAFSWRGLAKTDFIVDGGEVKRVLKDIDLMEISLVNIPAHQRALFAVAKAFYQGGTDLPIEKDADVRPLVVQSLMLSKEIFKGIKESRIWLAERGYRTEAIKATRIGWIVKQRDFDDFDKDSFLSVQLMTGVHAIVGHIRSFKVADRNENIRELTISGVNENVKFGRKLDNKDAEKLERFWEDISSLDDSSVDFKEFLVMPENDNDTKKVDEDQTNSQKSVKELIDSIVGGAVKGISEALSPLMEKQTEALIKLNTTIENFGKAQDKDEEEDAKEDEENDKSNDKDTENESENDEKETDDSKTKAAKKDAPDDSLKELTKELKKFTGVMTAVTKSLAGVDTNRDENISSEKDKDPNAVFDSLWGLND